MRVLIQRFSPTFSQVGINIIEAQKLVGVNINPFVVVKVGEEKRHTATQKSTNCPFYNEVRGVDMSLSCQSPRWPGPSLQGMLWVLLPSGRGASGTRWEPGPQLSYFSLSVFFVRIP